MSFHKISTELCLPIAFKGPAKEPYTVQFSSVAQPCLLHSSPTPRVHPNPCPLRR